MGRCFAGVNSPWNKEDEICNHVAPFSRGTKKPTGKRLYWSFFCVVYPSSNPRQLKTLRRLFVACSSPAHPADLSVRCNFGPLDANNKFLIILVRIKPLESFLAFSAAAVKAWGLTHLPRRWAVTLLSSVVAHGELAPSSPEAHTTFGISSRKMTLRT